MVRRPARSHEVILTTYLDIMTNCSSHLKPGGWFELCELGTVMFSDDKSMPEDWPPNLTFKYAQEAFAKLGRIVPTGEWMKKVVVEAGFVDVEVNHHLPQGRCTSQLTVSRLKPSNIPSGPGQSIRTSNRLDHCTH